MKIHIPAFEPILKANEHLAHAAFDIDLGEDVVQVVRCKDCLYSDKIDGAKPKYDCCNDIRFGCFQWLDGDDYCSYGKRKCE